MEKVCSKNCMYCTSTIQKYGLENLPQLLFCTQIRSSNFTVGHLLCVFMYESQVINAARTLAARPHSKVARENMDVFKEAWEQQLQVLTEAVDDITGIEDFLATTGKCIS